MRLDFKRALEDLHRDFDDFQRKQVPFANALGATTLAKGLQAEEAAGIKQTFDTPTPFTQNAFAIIPATKARQVATVFAKDIQAAYLEPFVDGGPHFLGGKKGLLVPKNIGLNQYGNLPRNKLKQLLSKPNVFVGPVKLKSGQVVNGIWQRNPVPRGERSGNRRWAGGEGYGTKGKHSVIDGSRTTLKLLIRFEDPLPVKEHLDFFGRGERYVRANATAAFKAAYAQALTSARPR